MIAKQASAWHFWVFLSTNFLFRRLAKEGRKIGELERIMLEDYSTPHGKRYFVNLSWVIPCCEQKLGIGAQAMCIACNDTSVIVINFRKSKTHTITDTYCTSEQLRWLIWPTFPLNFFYSIFTRDVPLLFLYHGAIESTMTKKFKWRGWGPLPK